MELYAIELFGTSVSYFLFRQRGDGLEQGVAYGGKRMAMMGRRPQFLQGGQVHGGSVPFVLGEAVWQMVEV